MQCACSTVAADLVLFGWRSENMKSCNRAASCEGRFYPKFLAGKTFIALTATGAIRAADYIKGEYHFFFQFRYLFCDILNKAGNKNQAAAAISGSRKLFRRAEQI